MPFVPENCCRLAGRRAYIDVLENKGCDLARPLQHDNLIEPTNCCDRIIAKDLGRSNIHRGRTERAKKYSRKPRRTASSMRQWHANTIYQRRFTECTLGVPIDITQYW